MLTSVGVPGMSRRPNQSTTVDLAVLQVRADQQTLPALAQWQAQAKGTDQISTPPPALLQGQKHRGAPAAALELWQAGSRSRLHSAHPSAAYSAAGSNSTASTPRFGSGALAGTIGASAALRSEDLLARMHSRQQVLNTAAQDDATAAASADPPSVAGPSSSYTFAETMSRQLVHYLQQHGGAANSSQIITSFPNIDQQHAVLFKQTLRQVAVLQRGATGGKQWHLKPDFARS